MNAFTRNIREVVRTILPIVALVLLVAIAYLDVPHLLLIRFTGGAIWMIVGLGIFLTGISTGIERIGTMLGETVKDFSGTLGVFLFGFLLGFIITIAEPDLMILSKNIEAATGISSYLIVASVSLGLGIMVGFGFLRILTGIRMRTFFTAFYVLLFAIFALQNTAFQNFAFDASGATTGAMTTPFLLALTIGVSKLKGADRGENDAFGMVGIASLGPIFAILILGFFSKIRGDVLLSAAEAFSFWRVLVHALKESTLAILPMTVLFYGMERWKLRLEHRLRVRVFWGLFYAWLGLILFLFGVYLGFTEVAYEVGRQLYAKSVTVFLLFGSVTGMLVVLAEPAVYALMDQIEQVTSGSVNRNFLRIFLSVGVALAILLSGLRVRFEALQLWMYVVPGFVLSLLLMWRVKPIFVGIAFDAGGVASGPMTATFLLSFMQGAASMSPSADPLLDGFGIIASVAMAPVMTIMLLGLLMSSARRKK